MQYNYHSFLSAVVFIDLLSLGLCHRYNPFKQCALCGAKRAA